MGWSLYFCKWSFVFLVIFSWPFSSVKYSGTGSREVLVGGIQVFVEFWIAVCCSLLLRIFCLDWLSSLIGACWYGVLFIPHVPSTLFNIVAEIVLSSSLTSFSVSKVFSVIMLYAFSRPIWGWACSIVYVIVKPYARISVCCGNYDIFEDWWSK